MPRMIVAIFLVAALVSGCGLGSSAGPVSRPMIEGGCYASPGDFPSAVRIGDPSGSVCTGTVIGQYTILTAAHCIVEQQWETIGAAIPLAVGTNEENFRHYPRRVVSIEYSPGYLERRAELGNQPPTVDGVVSDVAVVTVDRPLQLPIAAIDFTPIRMVDYLIFAGYGKDYETEWPVPSGKVLKYGVKRPSAYTRYYVQVPRGGVGDCSDASATGGDSGGAVYREDRRTVVGIIHAGDFVTQASWAARLDTIEEWLRSVYAGIIEPEQLSE